MLIIRQCDQIGRNYANGAIFFGVGGIFSEKYRPNDSGIHLNTYISSRFRIFFASKLPHFDLKSLQAKRSDLVYLAPFWRYLCNFWSLFSQNVWSHWLFGSVMCGSFRQAHIARAAARLNQGDQISLRKSCLKYIPTQNQGDQISLRKSCLKYSPTQNQGDQMNLRKSCLKYSPTQNQGDQTSLRKSCLKYSPAQKRCMTCTMVKRVALKCALLLQLYQKLP
jgi:hypothetical protein